LGSLGNQIRVGNTVPLEIILKLNNTGIHCEQVGVSSYYKNEHGDLSSLFGPVHRCQEPFEMRYH
jgi:hypothetical protein